MVGDSDHGGVFHNVPRLRRLHISPLEFKDLQRLQFLFSKIQTHINGGRQAALQT
jgi:hypothetical protein